MVVNVDIKGIESGLSSGYKYLLVWENGQSIFLSKHDVSAQIKAHRETNNKYSTYVLFEVKQVINPKDIFLGF